MPSMRCVSVTEWQKKNIIKPDVFKKLDAEDELAKKYKLRPVTKDDLYFTDEIEDDRINVTARFADYDWMSYTYDCRIPTKDIGTLCIRFEYFGATECDMYIKQFLPAYLTGETEDYVVEHYYNFESELFERFMNRDLIDRTKTDGYAYYSGPLMLEWFQSVLENGKLSDSHPVMKDMEWISIRIPKEGNKNAD